tara:strand:+ start:644 stop:778 length:135 start_codon:yes stop_codon:yes gene_type:complete
MGSANTATIAAGMLLIVYYYVVVKVDVSIMIAGYDRRRPALALQ